MKTTLSLIVLFLSSLCTVVNGAFGLGSCPAFTTMQNVDRSRFITTWYEQLHDWSIFAQFGTVCGQEIYTDDRADGYVQVEYVTYYWPFSFIPYLYQMRQPLVCDWNTGKCLITFLQDPPNLDQPDNFYIIDTDYDNFLTVYSCIELIPYILNFQSLWIMSREPTIDWSIIQSQQQKFKENVPSFWQWFWLTPAWQGDWLCDYRNR